MRHWRNAGGRQESRRRLVLTVIIGLLLLALGFVGIRFKTASGHRFPGSASADPLAHLPRVMLWAWERHEDLRTIDPRAVGVAYLAKTLFLRQNTVVPRPRLQPLQVPPATVLIPVVRIEIDKFSPPTLDMDQRTRAVAEIAAMSRVSTIPAVQVDFDAKTSERAFYRAVLHDLRQALSDTTRISITALASWCLADNWLAGLPIDEAVPMLFRMGADRQRVLSHLQIGGDVRCMPAQQSLGIATDEPLPHMLSRRRMYVFSPRAWSPASVRTALEEVKQWE